MTAVAFFHAPSLVDDVGPMLKHDLVEEGALTAFASSVEEASDESGTDGTELESRFSFRLTTDGTWEEQVAKRVNEHAYDREHI